MNLLPNPRFRIFSQTLNTIQLTHAVDTYAQQPMRVHALAPNRLEIDNDLPNLHYGSYLSAFAHNDSALA